MNNRTKSLATIAVIAALVGGGYYAWTTYGAAGLPQGIASGNGRIEATEVDISTKTAGRIREIMASEGDFVKPGAVLARMDTVQLEAKRAQAEATLRQAIIGIDTANSLVLQRQAEREAAAATVAQREAELDGFVRERFGAPAQFPRSPAAALGVRNAYAEPARLGIDRFLALVAAHAQQPRAQVLASVGTALTLDALGADGVHHGGLILAGPALMREALLAGTARVGTLDGQCVEMADNTADAVVSGSLCAAAGAIDRFRAAAARRLGAPAALLLTGGGADEVAPLVDGAERAHDLVLRGLAVWADAAAPAR